MALIAYLAAEKLPQHRERLADLLWNTAEARTNLRVELARIRSAGLNIFPASRQLLYLESISTDIDHWQLQQEHEMNQTELSAWLATLRGLPLCGLEDLGSTAFQVWVEQQRWMLCETVESVLARVYAHYVRSGQDWATRLISSRAEAVGFMDPAESLTDSLIDAALPLTRSVSAISGGSGGRGSALGVPAPQSRRAGQLGSLQASSHGAPQPGAVQPGIFQSAASLSADSPTPAPTASETLSVAVLDTATPNTGLHFGRPHEEAQLHGLLSATQPQIALLHGPPGSGKTYLAERLAAQAAPAWEVLRLTASRSGRLLLAALAQSLLKLAEPDQVQILRQVLLQPGALEEDMVKVAVAFSNIGQPLLLMLDEVHAAPAELTGLLELVCQMGSDHSRLLLLLGREAPDRQPVTRTLLRRLPGIQTLALPPVALASVQQVLTAHYPHESSARLQPLASRLAQRSEGNPLHLLSLLKALPDAVNLGDTDLGAVDLGSITLPQAVRDTFRSDTEGWTDTLRDAMSRLSVINGAFGRVVAQAVLNLERDTEVDALLCDALERQILLEVDQGVALQLPGLSPVRLVQEADTQYMFRNEALRVTLAGQLPQLIRQDVRRRLVMVLATEEPGLASYYAERVGLQDQASQLWAQHRERLPHDSPMLSQSDTKSPLRPEALPAQAQISEPERQVGALPLSVSHQGYSVSLEGGWLSVMSDGRYGHPQTLTLSLSWPAPLTQELRLVWRLDVFGGGEELRPTQTPFPLRLTPLKPEALPGHSRRVATELKKTHASVLTPHLTSQRSGEYHEQHLICKPLPGVQLGQWMEHRLGGPEWQGAMGVAISVRALDVALTIGVIDSGAVAEAHTNLIVQPPAARRKLKSTMETQLG